MTLEEFEFLKTVEAQELINQYIDFDPQVVALKIRNASIATQIKNLQKCRTKLPAFYEARCIIPSISYEQASSQLTAFTRTESGEKALDLTCGLGADTYSLSQRFSQVISLEIDPLRAEIARWNFQKLGAENIDVITSSAEDYLANTDSRFDHIFLDPARRNSLGRSVYAPEDCRPNALELLPKIRTITKSFTMKLSPLFDVAEIFKVFGQDSKCQVITVNNECKEVILRINDLSLPDLQLILIRDSHPSIFNFSRSQIIDTHQTIDIQSKYLFVPDIAFYKTRTIPALLQDIDYYYIGGYVFSEQPLTHLPGQHYEIVENIAYNPKSLRSRFRTAIIHIRNFPYSIQQIGIQQGGTQHLFFTTYQGQNRVFVVKEN